MASESHKSRVGYLSPCKLTLKEKTAAGNQGDGDVNLISFLFLLFGHPTPVLLRLIPLLDQHLHHCLRTFYSPFCVTLAKIHLITAVLFSFSFVPLSFLTKEVENVLPGRKGTICFAET